jgi:hypothetical protein
VLAVLALVLVPQLAVSPVGHTYAGWESAGETNRRTLTALGTEVETAPETDRLVVSGLPSGVAAQRRAFPRAESVGFLRANSIESWLRLRGEGDVRVTVAETGPIPEVPRDVSLSAETTDPRTLELVVDYEFDPANETDYTDRVDETGGTDGSAAPDDRRRPASLTVVLVSPVA